MGNEPATSIGDREIPPDVAEAIQLSFGLDEPPATLGDWMNPIPETLVEGGKDGEYSVSLSDLCTSDSSRHTARAGDEELGFHCVLDTLMLPFVLEEEAFDIRSRSPVSDEIIEISVTREGIEAPDDAVMSVGVATDVDPPDERGPSLAYERLCPYINAFVDNDEYQEWATTTPNAATMELSLTDGFLLAQSLASCCCA